MNKDDATLLLRSFQTKVASCVRELDRSKPVANRFCDELLKLLNDAEISIQNQDVLGLSVQELKCSLPHTQEQVEEANLNIERSENELKSMELQIQSSNDAAQLIENSVESKRGQVNEH